MHCKFYLLLGVLLLASAACKKDFNTQLLESNHNLAQDRYHQRQASVGEWNLWFHMDAPAYGPGQGPTMVYDLTSTRAMGEVKPFAIIDVELVQAVIDDPFGEKPEKLERYQFRGEVELDQLNAGHWTTVVDDVFKIGQPSGSSTSEAPQNWLPLKGNYWLTITVRPFGMQAIKLNPIPFTIKDGSGGGTDYYTNWAQ